MNKISVLVRILLAGSEGKTASAGWVDADQGCTGHGSLSRQERFELDCEYRRHLRQHLIPRHWDALIARYTLHVEDRKTAIQALSATVASHAHAKFKSYAILTWAEPKKPGAEGKRSTAILQSNIYDMNLWDDNQGTSERTRRRWRADIHDTMDTMLGEAINASIQILEQQELFPVMAA